MRWLVLLLLLASGSMAAERGLRQPEFIDIRQPSASVNVIKDDVVRIKDTAIMIAIKKVTNESLMYTLFPGETSAEIRYGQLQQVELENRIVNLNLLDVNTFKVATLFISHEPVEVVEVPAEVEITPKPMLEEETPRDIPSREGWLVFGALFFAGILLIILLHVLIGVRLFV